MGGKICNFNTVKRKECSPGEINRVVQDRKKSKGEGRLCYLISVLFFVRASSTLFLLFLLALQDGSRSGSRSKGDRLFKRPLTVNASFSFSARTLSAAAWSTYGCKPKVSFERVAQRPDDITPFSLHCPSPSIWLPTAFQSHLHVVQGFFCDQHKEVKADRQRVTRAYRNRHPGSRP